MDKLALALVIASQKLRSYFHSHTIHPRTHQLSSKAGPPETRCLRSSSEMGNRTEPTQYRVHASASNQRVSSYLPFEIMCNASDYAMGAILGQWRNKNFQPIYYASKTLTVTQHKRGKYLGNGFNGLMLELVLILLEKIGFCNGNRPNTSFFFLLH